MIHLVSLFDSYLGLIEFEIAFLDEIGGEKPIEGPVVESSGTSSQSAKTWTFRLSMVAPSTPNYLITRILYKLTL
jgi:hypothetical protein